MPIRVQSMAQLANELTAMTWSMGGLLLESGPRRSSRTAFEDHF